MASSYLRYLGVSPERPSPPTRSIRQQPFTPRIRQANPVDRVRLWNSAHYGTRHTFAIMAKATAWQAIVWWDDTAREWKDCDGARRALPYGRAGYRDGQRLAASFYEV
jgi:hypothetical protein